MELFSKNILPYPTGFYLFKVNNENSETLREICSKLTTKIPERYVINYVLVSLLLHLNILHKLFWCFICWLWTKNVGYADVWQGPKYASAKFEALPSLAKKPFFVRAEEWVKWIDPVTKYMFIVNNKDTWTKYLSTRDISRVAYVGLRCWMGYQLSESISQSWVHIQSQLKITSPFFQKIAFAI